MAVSNQPTKVLRHALLALVLFSVWGNACGVDVLGLFSARVEARDRSPEQMRVVAREALVAVLIKVTGNRFISSHNGIDVLLHQASDLLLSYSYEVEELSGALHLWAEFDAPALLARLNSMRIPTWSKERPEALVWLVVEEGTQRRIASSDEPLILGDALKKRASQRGIPLLFPLLDIEEARNLTPLQDWQGLAATALTLSSRYGTPATLVGYVRDAAPGLWVADWVAQVEGEVFSWSQDGTLPTLLTDDGIDHLADTLAGWFAHVSNATQDERVTLNVYGVNSLADYARLSNYLQALDTVTAVFPAMFEADLVSFEITTRSGASGLAQGIAFGDVLLPLDTPVGAYALRH